MTINLNIGDQAPEFSIPDDQGKTLSLKDLRGQNVVLYFYPKDDTPGCTAEAIAFTGLGAEFARQNTVVIGVSKDTPAKHAKFRQKYDLGIILASDEEGAVIERYGAWVEKNMYGRKYMGIERATFLIDSTAIIRQVWRKVKVKGHAETVLTAVQNL